MPKGHFRPCIDIHNGVVKQIVGGALTDDFVKENFVSDTSARDIADIYRQYKLKEGHIIILNKKGTPEYEAGVKAAKEALHWYTGGMSLGGGIDPSNAEEFLKAGASAVIVTSYVFSDGKINFPNLEEISSLVTPSRLILDLSVRKIDGGYRITTDRWQKITEEPLDMYILAYLSHYCSEYLIHAVDKEGKRQGIDKELVKLLSEFKARSGFNVNYAGGVRDIKDAQYLSDSGLDFTVGSALNIFGGNINIGALAKIFA
ncbi:MAG: phosphoribosylformimino-5-aminoimidazole carboxamide ribotide isomerase [Ruminococcus sp.]|jgi:phosphoribosylformimino-5-aminoimidazole carboxamide ribotide isomerase|nr:phosphoribosylformimino-5-aminoimidazole carboxamide ribotide isomerase [Ruminococcus sp.]